DVLSIYTFRFTLENGVLYFDNIGNGLRLSDTLKKSEASKEFLKDAPKVKGSAEKSSSVPVAKALYLEYHLSPRIREELPTEPIVLSSAPSSMKMPGGRRGNWAYLLSSGAMMAASLATGMISPAALLARSMGMISPIANMAMFGKMSKEEKRQVEEYEQMRQQRYQAYIADQKARIKKVADIQRRIVTEENPVPIDCIATVDGVKRNLWERMSSDSDFLSVRLGLGKNELCVEVKSRGDMDGFQMMDDELEELAGKIIEETRYVDNIPVRI
ncbi:MAG: type VII secretion protein EssC, partial [Eubacteriales bacterium]|nr:type VII secretion protein EssC [Eubacteriales bacterium]